jgi:guanylate kinase
MNTLETKINTYKMSDEVAELVQQSRLLLIAAPVGGGKNTVINELLKSDDFYEIISHTTRAPRENHGVLEQNGTAYHFIGLSEAERMLDAQEFVEAKYVHGNIYGTSAEELRRARELNRIAVTDIDINGVKEYLAIKPDTHAIFLLPPSVEMWLMRLGRRYGDLDQHAEEVTTRFATALQEIQSVLEDPRFVIVVNDDLETTVERIRQIVNGVVSVRSDYANAVTEHLIEFLKVCLKK